MKNLQHRIQSWRKGHLSLTVLFEEIWLYYHPKLQTYVQNFYNSPVDTKDLVSEILLHAFECIDSYDSHFAFSTWIYTLARNSIVDQLRKKKVKSEHWDEQILSHTDTPESIQLKETEQSLIRQAVRELSTMDRELIYLHFYEDLTYPEISPIVGIPVGTIKYRMSECRKKLKGKLKKELAYERYN